MKHPETTIGSIWHSLMPYDILTTSLLELPNAAKNWKGGSNCLISNVSSQKLTVSRRQWPKLGWELTSVWSKLTQSKSGNWRLLTAKFQSLTFFQNQILATYVRNQAVAAPLLRIFSCWGKFLWLSQFLGYPQHFFLYINQ